MADAGLIFQRDGTMLVTAGDGLDRLLQVVRKCAQLRTIVAGNHVYELSQVALWGSAAQGARFSDLIASLDRWSHAPVPAAFAARIADIMSRYGAFEIVERARQTTLVARDPSVLGEIGVTVPTNGAMSIALERRDVAKLKLAAVQAGWPIVDRRRAACTGTHIGLSERVRLRQYQSDAVASFEAGRNGVILLPCGAGKTIVGVAAAVAVGGPVLVLVPSRTVGEQWQSAFVELTDCHPSSIGWIDDRRDGLTIATVTYQAATSGNAAGELSGRPWRLVIYDEVQSLPADVFRFAAVIEAERRLGLSATLVREDGREAEVFALVGPPLFEASWLELERDGWIAPARCVEVRVPAAATPAEDLRYKMAVTRRLVEQHDGEPTIVVGTDVTGLLAAGRRLAFPVLTGSSSAERRVEVFEAFRSGALKVLGLSRIGSVGIDLPGASVLIQVSGTFGSRQEEAQRLGRVLRPAPGKTAHFYTIVAAGTREQHFAARRQRFLVNQGYRYEIVDASELPRRVGDVQ
ncbi:MAG: helicase-associated domain-containing protein [Thermomicrobiales bacterium]